MKPEMEAHGFRFITTARLIRTGIFSGVFHVLSYRGDEVFVPPLVVRVPGEWKTEEDACRGSARVCSHHG